MKILVNPDIHGRTFWKEYIDKLDEFDKIIFLGDYLDPYDFEHISVKDSIDNFKNIIEFKQNNMDKVILLLGNHDMPYYSSTYYKFSYYHSRHSKMYHSEIHDIFKQYKDLFQIAYVCDNILFTHAGVTPGWLLSVFTKQYQLTSLDDLVFSLNNLLNTDKGLSYLYMISDERGGRDKFGSCIWADVNESIWYQKMLEYEDNINKTVYDIMKIKQVFGHTLQAFYNKDGNIEYDDIIEIHNIKMLDNCKSYIIDSETFNLIKSSN